MSFTDPIGDMIARFRNAQLRGLKTVNIPNSKFRAKILEVLKHEGYISDFKLVTNEKNIGINNIFIVTFNQTIYDGNFIRIKFIGRNIYK